jgi:hypothetical protein
MRWFENDVLEQPIDLIFKDQDFQEMSWTSLPLKKRLVESSETSVLNHLAPRNNPENGKIQSQNGHHNYFFKRNLATGFSNGEEVCVPSYGNLLVKAGVQKRAKHINSSLTLLLYIIQE